MTSTSDLQDASVYTVPLHHKSVQYSHSKYSKSIIERSERREQQQSRKGASFGWCFSFGTSLFPGSNSANKKAMHTWGSQDDILQTMPHFGNYPRGPCDLANYGDLSLECEDAIALFVFGLPFFIQEISPFPWRLPSLVVAVQREKVIKQFHSVQLFLSS